MASKSVNIIECRDLVENIEIVWIPMRDGRKLAARLLLPKDKAERPVPAILEYIPYRRRDGTRPRDDETHYWFAANGYGVARVDIAGSGDSEGLIQDEYHKREQDDALEIMACRAGLVHGLRRHDRHFLGRVQRTAGGRPKAARAEGRRFFVFHRGPICG